MVAGNLNALIGSITVGKAGPKPSILVHRSPRKPLVTRPKIIDHKPLAMMIKPPSCMVLLILPIPLYRMKPIITTKRPYPASVKQKPKKKGYVRATNKVGSISMHHFAVKQERLPHCLELLQLP